MAEMLAPKLGERVADFACGTGGFLTSALKILAGQVETPRDRELYSASVYGIEKKQLPYLLCVTNMPYSVAAWPALAVSGIRESAIAMTRSPAGREMERVAD